MGSNFEANHSIERSWGRKMGTIGGGRKRVGGKIGNGKLVCFSLAFRMDTDGKPMYTCGSMS